MFPGFIKRRKIKNVPILVFGNKADLENYLGPDEVIEKLELDYIAGRDWSMYGCSALKGLNIKDGIEWIFEKLSVI